MDGLSFNRILVGVDNTDEAIRASEYAIALAARYDAELIMLQVIDSKEYEALETGDRKAETLSADGEALLDGIAEKAREENVSCRGSVAYGFDTHRKLIHPGSVVLDIAEELETDFIVLPRAGIDAPAELDGTLARAAAYTVLYASQPVLSV